MYGTSKAGGRGGVNAGNLTAVLRWIPAARALAEASRESLDADRLASGPASAKCRCLLRTHAQRCRVKTERAARVARALRLKAFGPEVD